MEKIETFQNRLNKAMKEKEVRAYQLSSMTGISRPLLSNYTHGQAVAGEHNITAIAKALGVNEIWLLGYDCAMERPTEEQEDLKDEVFRLVNDLGDEDLKKVRIFIKEILK
jgi:transcriptional regulator with XRE-family HTH domain